MRNGFLSSIRSSKNEANFVFILGRIRSKLGQILVFLQGSSRVSGFEQALRLGFQSFDVPGCLRSREAARK